jgi:hypothetical protein
MALWFELRPARRIDRQLLRPSAGVTEGRVVNVAHAWPAYVRGATWVLGAVLLWLVLYGADAPGETAVVVLLVLLRGAWLLLQAYEDRFVVTDMRIMRIQGVLNQRTAAMSLSRIVDFTMEQPFFGQVSTKRFGHLVFENAAQDQGLREIRYVPHVVQLNKLVQNRVFEAGGGPARHMRQDGDVERGAHAPAASAGPWDMDATGEIPRVMTETAAPSTVLVRPVTDPAPPRPTSGERLQQWGRRVRTWFT